MSTLIFPLGAGFLGAALRVRSAAPITALPQASPHRRHRFPRRLIAGASSYDASASFHDPSSCVWPRSGCTETRAANFDALAAVDDGSCFLLGCTDSTQLGFDPEANLDDATCRTALSGCADVAAVNHWPMGTIDREDPGLCRYTGCTDSVAANFNPSATDDDGGCEFTRAGLVASAFGYLDSCSAFVDTDADLRQDEDEPRGRTDRGGYLSLTRRTSHYVQLLPGSVDSPSCTDGLLGVRLQVLLLTHASAEVMTPLTTLASVLSMPGRGLTRSEASDTVWRGLELPERSVWEFDALAQIFAAPAQRESALWLVRQQQVLGAVTCAYRLIADVIPDFDPITFSFAAFAALADMIRTASVSLTAPESHMQLANQTASTLDLQFSDFVDRAYDTSAECAKDSRALADIVASFLDGEITRRRILAANDVAALVCSLVLAAAPSGDHLCGRSADNASALFGCLDPGAANFDPAAHFSAGSCVHEGCTSSAAANFDPRASVDDGSCRPVRVGCTIDVAVNFDSAANRLDDSCEFILLGCTESAASNYERRATWDDGSCVPDVRGCVVPSALNFDSAATTNWGCQFVPSEPRPAEDLRAGCTDPEASNFESLASAYQVGACRYDVTGCTDPSSVNYLRVATLDDGSCRARPPGCLSPLAANYDSDANIDMPASCVFPDAGCTVESALNFEPDATRDDGSCLFGRAGCDDSRALKCAAALPAAQKANPCPAAATSPHRVLPVLLSPARPRCLPSSPVAGTAFVRRGRRKHSAPVPVVGALPPLILHFCPPASQFRPERDGGSRLRLRWLR